MSATETKFNGREIVEMISETKLGDLGVFMANAVKAGYEPVDVAVSIESNFAATLILFVDTLPVEVREKTIRTITENVSDWSIRWLEHGKAAEKLETLVQSAQGAPAPAAAE